MKRALARGKRPSKAPGTSCLVTTWQNVGDGENDGGSGDEKGDQSVHEPLLRTGCSDRLAGNLTSGLLRVNILSARGVVELYLREVYELGR
jgi:hypothetical protein